MSPFVTVLGVRYDLDEREAQGIENLVRAYVDVQMGKVERHMMEMDPDKWIIYPEADEIAWRDVINGVSGNSMLHTRVRYALCAQHIPRIVAYLRRLLNGRNPWPGLKMRAAGWLISPVLMHMSLPSESRYLLAYLRTHPDDSGLLTAAIAYAFICYLQQSPLSGSDLVGFLGQLLSDYLIWAPLPLDDRALPFSKDWLDQMIELIDAFVAKRTQPNDIPREFLGRLGAIYHDLLSLKAQYPRHDRLWQMSRRKSERFQHVLLTRKLCQAVGCADKGIAVCGRCKCYRYCSRACQRRDWRHHRPTCFEPYFRGAYGTERT
jgi:hypothetical protein